MSKQDQEIEKTDGAHKACNQANKEFYKDKLPGPSISIGVGIGNEGETKVGKNKGFKAKTNHLEGYTRDMLALWRKVVPPVMCHNNARSEQRYDAREMR